MDLPKVVALSVIVTAGVDAAWVGSGKAAKGVKPAVQLTAVVAVHSDQQNEASRLASQVAFLQAQISDLRGQVKTAGDNNTGTPGAIAEAPSEPPLPIEEQRAQAEERRSERMVRVGTSFQGEARNANWARSMESTLLESLHADDVRLNARSVECRATACRIELDDDGSATLQPKVERLPMRVGDTLPVMQVARSQSGADRRLTLYFSPTARPVSK